MAALQKRLVVTTQGQGLYPITAEVNAALADTSTSSGLVHIFVQHTSASLVIQENADPTAKLDLEEFMNRLVPEQQSWHRHLDEGPDDTVSHMKASVLPTSLTIPMANGKLSMGTWQGLYLWEHRRSPHQRTLIITVLS